VARLASWHRLVHAEATRNKSPNLQPEQPAQLNPNYQNLRPHQSPFRTQTFTEMSTVAGGHVLQRFFTTNKAWAQAVTNKDSNFFKTLAEAQYPEMLWLGCADSRVPESVVLAVKPGEVFVHRNIAK
jgi:hypothetical protein